MLNYVNKKIALYLSSAIELTGAHSLFKKVYGGLGHILMFHRVLPHAISYRIHNHTSLEISTQHLENIIMFLKKEKYHFISLDEVPDFISDWNNKTRFSVFTFDDGYFDNFQYAFPVFEKHKVPFTVYITTDLPDKKAVLWWYYLEDLMLQKKQISFSWKGISYSFSLHNNILKERGFVRLRKLLIQTPGDELAELLRIMGGRDFDRYRNKMEQLGMSWEQIREMSGSNLVTIGAHTITHRSLAELPLEEVRHEVEGSRAIISEKIGKPVKHFSYPFGKTGMAGEREYKLVKECGFVTATTTLFGNIQQQHINHLYSLPRITVNSMVSTSVLNLSVNGLIPAVRNGFRKVVA
jgi:peptidoglycan/xylan/chitin deacetylase (PgdA/CDA1 family)